MIRSLSFVRTSVMMSMLLVLLWMSTAAAGETLYNGIKLPSPWPPEYKDLSREKPLPVPYLESPPDVIPIDVGRQLFVDDFLIEKTTLTRTFHKTKFHPASPVLEPVEPWERETDPKAGIRGIAAMVFSDGVWFDPADRLFKMWYMAGFRMNRCLATSIDGIHWKKPALDVVPGTNIVSPGVCDTATIWLDQETKDPQQRYKMWREDAGHRGQGIYYSADGIHWSGLMGRTGPGPSPSTVFYNPFRKVWVYSVRCSATHEGRYRRYWETPDPVVNIRWDKFKRPRFGPQSGKDPRRLPLWVAADKNDLPYPGTNFKPGIYNLDAVAYESVVLGMFSMLRGYAEGRPKIKELVAGFSRDGFHWDRPFREPIIGVSKSTQAWNAGNIQSAGGCCLVVGDKLYFYVSGRRQEPGSDRDYVCTTGLAILRRDGFASMDAGASSETLTTRPVRFSGKHLFVNLVAPSGKLQVEVLDRAGKVISSLSRDLCTPISTDKTLQAVQWKGTSDLSALSGKQVRFRFHLTNGQLYAFWVSPETSGASHGYVAAGGPGFTGPTDTVGKKGKSKRINVSVHFEN